MDDAPAYDGDLFDAAGITDPYGHYRAVRDLGPAVWLPSVSVFAVGRYDDVRAVLADHDRFVSGQGVALNEPTNAALRGTTLASDPPVHDDLRQLVAHRLTPRALRAERAAIEATIEAVVSGILDRARGGTVEVDAVPEIAQAVPMSVVPDFLGFPPDCRDRLIGWAQGALEALGPMNERSPEAFGSAGDLAQYVVGLVERKGTLPDSLGSEILAAAERGEIRWDQCPALLTDYFGPSMETTVSALGSGLRLFAENPEQWDRLRADPTLVAGAFNEIVRLESPLRGFSRVAARDTAIGDVRVPEGARVWVLYASANRDERKWDRPDVFDITRDNGDHLGLGYGLHGCAGQGLARIEVGAVLTRLAESVRRLEPTGPPTLLLNSIARAHSSVPLRLHVA